MKRIVTANLEERLGSGAAEAFRTNEWERLKQWKAEMEELDSLW